MNSLLFNNRQTLPYIKVEDDNDIIIDLDAPSAPTYCWDEDMRKLLSQAVNGKTLIEDILKQYTLSLQKQMQISTDKVKLKEKMITHLNFFKLHYMEINDYMSTSNYYELMEDILALYCTLELDVVRKKHRNRKKMKKKFKDEVTERIFSVLAIFLGEKEMHMLHVLLKLKYTCTSEACCIIMKRIFKQVLFRYPVQCNSDESFSRKYIIFLMCKELVPPEEHEMMDLSFFHRFKRPKESIKTNKVLSSIFTMDSASLVDTCNFIMDLKGNVVTKYFNYMKRKKRTDELAMVPNDISISFGDMSVTDDLLNKPEFEISEALQDVLPNCTDAKEVIDLDDEDEVENRENNKVVFVYSSGEDSDVEMKYMELKKVKKKKQMPVTSEVIDLDDDSLDDLRVPPISSTLRIEKENISETHKQEVSVSDSATNTKHLDSELSGPLRNTVDISIQYSPPQKEKSTENSSESSLDVPTITCDNLITEDESSVDKSSECSVQTKESLSKLKLTDSSDDQNSPTSENMCSIYDKYDKWSLEIERLLVRDSNGGLSDFTNSMMKFNNSLSEAVNCKRTELKHSALTENRKRVNAKRTELNRRKTQIEKDTARSTDTDTETLIPTEGLLTSERLSFSVKNTRILDTKTCETTTLDSTSSITNTTCSPKTSVDSSNSSTSSPNSNISDSNSDIVSQHEIASNSDFAIRHSNSPENITQEVMITDNIQTSQKEIIGEDMVVDTVEPDQTTNVTVNNYQTKENIINSKVLIKPTDTSSNRHEPEETKMEVSDCVDGQMKTKETDPVLQPLNIAKDTNSNNANIVMHNVRTREDKVLLDTAVQTEVILDKLAADEVVLDKTKEITNVSTNAQHNGIVLDNLSNTEIVPNNLNNKILDESKNNAVIQEKPIQEKSVQDGFVSNTAVEQIGSNSVLQDKLIQQETESDYRNDHYPNDSVHIQEVVLDNVQTEVVSENIRQKTIVSEIVSDNVYSEEVVSDQMSNVVEEVQNFEVVSDNTNTKVVSDNKYQSEIISGDNYVSEVILDNYQSEQNSRNDVSDKYQSEVSGNQSSNLEYTSTNSHNSNGDNDLNQSLIHFAIHMGDNNEENVEEYRKPSYENEDCDVSNVEMEEVPYEDDANYDNDSIRSGEIDIGEERIEFGEDLETIKNETNVPSMFSVQNSTENFTDTTSQIKFGNETYQTNRNKFSEEYNNLQTVNSTNSYQNEAPNQSPVEYENYQSTISPINSCKSSNSVYTSDDHFDEDVTMEDANDTVIERNPLNTEQAITSDDMQNDANCNSFDSGTLGTSEMSISPNGNVDSSDETHTIEEPKRSYEFYKRNEIWNKLPKNDGNSLVYMNGPRDRFDNDSWAKKPKEVLYINSEHFKKNYTENGLKNGNENSKLLVDTLAPSTSHTKHRYRYGQITPPSDQNTDETPYHHQMQLSPIPESRNDIYKENNNLSKEKKYTKDTEKTVWNDRLPNKLSNFSGINENNCIVNESLHINESVVDDDQSVLEEYPANKQIVFMLSPVSMNGNGNQYVITNPPNNLEEEYYVDKDHQPKNGLSTVKIVAIAQKADIHAQNHLEKPKIMYTSKETIALSEDEQRKESVSDHEFQDSFSGPLIKINGANNHHYDNYDLFESEECNEASAVKPVWEKEASKGIKEEESDYPQPSTSGIQKSEANQHNTAVVNKRVYGVLEDKAFSPSPTTRTIRPILVKKHNVDKVAGTDASTSGAQQVHKILKSALSNKTSTTVEDEVSDISSMSPHRSMSSSPINSPPFEELSPNIYKAFAMPQMHEEPVPKKKKKIQFNLPVLPKTPPPQPTLVEPKKISLNLDKAYEQLKVKQAIQENRFRFRNRIRCNGVHPNDEKIYRKRAIVKVPRYSEAQLMLNYRNSVLEKLKHYTKRSCLLTRIDVGTEKSPVASPSRVPDPEEYLKDNPVTGSNTSSPEKALNLILPSKLEESELQIEFSNSPKFLQDPQQLELCLMDKNIEETTDHSIDNLLKNHNGKLPQPRRRKSRKENDVSANPGPTKKRKLGRPPKKREVLEPSDRPLPSLNIRNT